MIDPQKWTEEVHAQALPYTLHALCLESITPEVVVSGFKGGLTLMRIEAVEVTPDNWPETNAARWLLDLVAGGNLVHGRTPELEALLHDWLSRLKGYGVTPLVERIISGSPPWRAPLQERVRQAEPGGEPSIALPASLAAPGVRSGRILVPPIMQLTQEFCAINGSKAHLDPFIDEKNNNVGGLLYRKKKGDLGLQFLHPAPVPDALRNANVEREVLLQWAREGLRSDLSMFDDEMWDVIALSIYAFFARTKGKSIDETFILTTDDFLDWRDVDARKRTEDVRREVFDRYSLACSDRFRAIGTETLHITTPSGKRKEQTFDIAGPILVRHYDYYRRGQAHLQLFGTDRPHGIRASLGHWARCFVEEDAMIGIFLKRLSQYDLRRELWERRLGWYLVFQLQNQWNSGRHPLKTETLLDGTRIPWKGMAKKNVQRVINQFVGELEGDALKGPGALENLKRDGIIRDYRCLENNPYGLNLPRKSRKEQWLQYRWDIDPGPELERHLVGKQEAAKKAREAAKKRKERQEKGCLEKPTP